MIIFMAAHYSWTAALLSETEGLAADPSPAQRARTWLAQQGVQLDCLLPLAGYSNHVFWVKQSGATYPAHSVIRLADFSLSIDLCPLAYRFEAVVQRHRDMAALELAPEVIAAEPAAGVLWLHAAGQQKALRPAGFAHLRDLLSRLHHSGLDWGEAEPFRLRDWLRAEACPNALSHTATKQALYQQAQQDGYFDYPLVPIHGDLNPGNLLYDGRRWWLIDWDFGAMQPREWDLASLIVEHDWRLEQALAFAPEMTGAAIKWFCSCFALLSWQWHRQRGSQPQVLAAKARTMDYWIALKG